ncbi:putative membrane protein [Mycobacterium ulcerans str. Harvey]|uniref:Membrane protein n=1 Tax=Mycobacterium ulcerans str. Harvey TaxID=1299332 RepID=A0ABP3ALN1_MYCUL|nr:putative membrane protein [Mycobacterium ulcerans str. Harvey]
MGAEIDSLADAVNFGVTPALVLYVTMLSKWQVGWVVVLLYAVCVVLRLARFNALLDDGTQPAYAHEFFVGMPAPAGAVSMIGLLALKMQCGEGWWTSVWFLAFWITGTSMLMVSGIPMKKMHAVAVPPNLAAVLLAVLAIMAAAAVLAPYILIWVIIIAYVCHIPFAVRSKRWLAEHPEVWGDKPKQRRAARRAIRRAQPHRRSVARRSVARLGCASRAGGCDQPLWGSTADADRPAEHVGGGLTSRRGAVAPERHCRPRDPGVGCGFVDRVPNDRGGGRHG